MHRTFIELLEQNAEHAEEFDSRFDDVQDSQHPDVVTVCCSDSRVLQDHIWGNDEPGRIFTCGNIGNRVIQRTDSGEVVSGDVLYPVEHTGTDTVVVMGHTGCGAVTATYDALTGEVSEPAGIEHCLSLLKPKLEAGVESLPDDVSRAGAINRLVEYNVDRQVESLIESDDIDEDVDIIGVVYDFQDVYSERRGQVHVINVNGETSVETLKDDHPDIDARIERLWEY
ncbi:MULTISPECIES: carbonic anhydrase [unclassified Haladaptatus]|uniref:carbonic anhydrase n=1 Tax=unclassified Haladaptatus TaxID=2622732 RepID=UPI00209C0C22|nr:MULTISPECIES: carbonic anhydrase [unclassified Haladaptatus]MCO8243908.1 IcfA [Haladaptatus sp. AB643]MCO8256443.1 IcfA [Haladaptatus sp. AB618]